MFDRLLWSPLSVAAWAFRAGASINRLRFERGLPTRRRVDARVISVGSLLVGGSGKTPLASWLAEKLHRRGHKVALLSRGYRARREQVVTVVSDGKTLHGSIAEAGDEPVLLAGQVAGVPVIVSKDRGLAALRAISSAGAEILILDDGFQHHRLHRDLDIVTFDANFGAGNGRVLPRGPLREPLSALERAHAIVAIDGDVSEGLDHAIGDHAPMAPRFIAHRVPVSLGTLRGNVRVSPDALRGMQVGLIAGIARPESLRQTVEALGANVVAERIFRDHHRYRAKDLRGLADEAPIWITSEKDAGKIMPAWVGAADVRVLGVRLALEQGDELVRFLEDELGIGERR